MASASTTVAEPTRAPEVVIRPAGRWAPLRLREIWEYRRVALFPDKAPDSGPLQAKLLWDRLGWYFSPSHSHSSSHSFLAAWPGLVRQGLPYPVFAITAFVPWLFFSQSVTESARSLVTESELLSKVYFPRVVIPLSKVLSLLVDLVIALGVVVVFILLYGVELHAAAPLMPLFLVLAFIAAVGIGILLAALNVRYRDVQVVIPLLVLLWLFATPVVYPVRL